MIKTGQLRKLINARIEIRPAFFLNDEIFLILGVSKWDSACKNWYNVFVFCSGYPRRYLFPREWILECSTILRDVG